MTENTEKDVSIAVDGYGNPEWCDIVDGLTDEQISHMIAEDVMIMMKCESCGFEEEVPDWILDEFMEEDILSGVKNAKPCVMCPRCEKTMYKK